MTLAEVISAVTDFASDYMIYVTAGIVIGLGVNAVRRLVKGLR